MRKKRKIRRHPFSAADIQLLKQNPYVLGMTAYVIRFTEEFYELAYQKRQEGISYKEIFRSCGIPPEVLGDDRVAGFSDMLRNKSKRAGKYRDLRGAASEKSARERNQDRKIQLLEAELAYTKQEVEFLKKLHQANMEEQKKWGSKRGRE